MFTDNVSIAYGAVIENAVGGGGADRLIGNAVANTLTGNGGADVFELRSAGVSGVDRITDFGRTDVLAVNRAISDSNRDGIITWRAGNALTLDSRDGDQVTLAGVTATSGLRYLGFAEGLYYYGTTATRPVAKSGQRVYESKIAGETLNGSTSTTTTDVFFYDTGNATPWQGADRVTFTARDLLITTTRVADADGDGVITFDDGILDLTGNGGTIALRNGAAITSLELDGSVERNGVIYFVYSTVGSAVGLADLSV